MYTYIYIYTYTVYIYTHKAVLAYVQYGTAHMCIPFLARVRLCSMYSTYVRRLHVRMCVCRCSTVQHSTVQYVLACVQAWPRRVRRWFALSSVVQSVGLVVQVGWVLADVCSCNRCDVSCLCRASMVRPAQYTDVEIGFCQGCVPVLECAYSTVQYIHMCSCAVCFGHSSFDRR